MLCGAGSLLLNSSAMLPPSLTDLANKHGTDKGTAGPSEGWGAHNYTDVYEPYFEQLRQKPISILEVGLGVTGEKWPTRIAHGKNAEGGASLKTWYEYFPNAKIYGADINAAPYLDNDRIKTFVVDQGNVEDLQAFAKAVDHTEFDIIIDDGSHRADHQQITLGFLFKMLKSGGLYFVEDLIDNGLGDPNLAEHGIHASADVSVKNTRKVLKQFQTTGAFAEPNVLLDPEYLAKNIDYMSFHVPQKVPMVAKTRLERVKARLTGKGFRLRWKMDSEKICVLRKK
jgi:hypothetical protein